MANAMEARISAVLDLKGITPGIPFTRVAEELQRVLDNMSVSSTSGDLTFTVHVVGLGGDPRDIPG